jgi:nucleoredoxin
MEAYLGTDLIKSKTGTLTPDEAVSGAKLVLLYFSMHTCPPCREFTPILAELYRELNETEKTFEVIFFSGDKNDELYNEYYAEMPWLALPRGDARIASVAKKFDVRGVPRLIVLKADGTVINDNAVKKVTNEGPGAFEEFLSK